VKILILHQHFKSPATGGAIRSYYLARALHSRGMEVCVVTAHNEKVYKVGNVEGIEVHCLPVPYSNSFGFAARSTSFLKYVLGVMRLAGKFRDVDCVYAISAPLTVGLAALWIKWRYKVPYIFEVGDLWPEAPIQLGVIRNIFFKQFLYWLEGSVYRSAKSIVALSAPIKAAIDQKRTGKEVQIIPNMADCEFFRPVRKDAVLEKKFGVAGKFVVSYIGAVGLANGLDCFLECANACRKISLPIQFLLCGEGALRERLRKNADHLKLRNLTFLDFTNRDGVQEVMNVTDAIFVCYKPVPILETGSPNKFFDGLAAGKLIIVNFSGWIRKEIEASRCGFFVEAHRPETFVEKISPFVTDSRLLIQYQEAARNLAEKKYARTLLSDQFCRLFQGLSKPQHVQ